MAYIERRQSGYMVQIRRKGMRQLSRTFDLKADAEAWARDVERELQRGNAGVLNDDAGKTLFRELLDLYENGPLLLLKEPGKNRAALRAARDQFGSSFLSSIRAVDVAVWRDQLTAGGLAPATALRYLAVLSTVFTFAEKELSIVLPIGNPVHSVRKPVASPARDRRLRPGEYEAVQSKRPELLAFIILAIETSMRRGELIKLRWEYLNVERRTAHLPDTKNGASRAVALSSVSIAALQSLPSRINGLVWPWATPDGFSKAWRRHVVQARKSHIQSRLREALVREGFDAESEIRALVYKKRQPSQRTLTLQNEIESTDPFLTDLKFHDLRHEATSRLFEKGLGIMEVASMTGHKSLAMLMRYTHMDAEKLAQKLG